MTSALEETKRSADAASQAVAAAVAASKMSDDHFRQDQRPYVWLWIDPTRQKRDEPLFESDLTNPNLGRIVWTWRISNYGRSPAHGVVLTHGMEIGDDAYVRPRTLESLKPGPDRTPLPQTAQMYSTAASKILISRQEFERLMRIPAGIVMFGRVLYSDAAGTQFETGFCHFHHSTGAHVFCPDGGNYVK